mmetsp:Transcript_49826/g.131364  ORF Transcript_49826/g.131364 Transcript_49826/m.131364 type:complete len:110 (+) Transcript_49826:3-332(+)
MIHIEDPFDIERNLNCVLAPRHNEGLWLALSKAADAKPPKIPEVNGQEYPELASNRVWRSSQRKPQKQQQHVAAQEGPEKSDAHSYAMPAEQKAGGFRGRMGPRTQAVV